MFKFLKNLSVKAKKIMLSVGTGVVAASAMAIAACAEGADGSATTLDISTIVNSAGSTLQTQFVALVQALVPVVIAVAVAGLGMFAIVNLFKLGKKLFKTAAE